MNPVLVHPGHLVCVHIQRPGENDQVFRCVSCRYIQVPGPAIGVQLIYDPANQAPGAEYYGKHLSDHPGRGSSLMV